MRIALFGATGMIGSRILAEALRRGHDVTAIARDPSKIQEKNAQLTPAKGNLLDPADVNWLAKSHDAVISAFSPTFHDATQPPDSLVAAARSLIKGLSKAGVKRLLVVGGAGSLETAPGVRVIDDPHFPPAWKPVAQAHADCLDVFKKEAALLEWSYFSPAAMIEPGARTGHFRIGGDQLVTDTKGESRISAEDYAVAMIDELEKPQHVRRRFTIGY